MFPATISTFGEVNEHHCCVGGHWRYADGCLCRLRCGASHQPRRRKTVRQGALVGDRPGWLYFDRVQRSDSGRDQDPRHRDRARDALAHLQGHQDQADVPPLPADLGAELSHCRSCFQLADGPRTRIETGARVTSCAGFHILPNGKSEQYPTWPGF